MPATFIPTPDWQAALDRINLCPFKPLLPGTKLEMILDDAEVGFTVADHGEEGLGSDFGEAAVVTAS